MLDVLTCIELILNCRSACALLQNSAIASLVKVMREAHAAERKTLFVVGSYHIGKERAFFGAARAMGFKIWCHAAKKRVSNHTDNSCTIHCSCIGQSDVSLATSMLFQPLPGSHCMLVLSGHTKRQNSSFCGYCTQTLECVACNALLWLSSNESILCFACQATMGIHGMLASGSSSSDVLTI